MENSREIKLNTHTHIFSCFLGSISMETSREASHQNTVEVCRLSGYLGLGWISVALREGYTLKGDPPGSFPVSLLHTHTLTQTPVCLGYHFTSRPCSVWSLEAPRKCIPLTAMSDRISVEPPGSMIPITWCGRLYCFPWGEKPQHRLI